MHVKKLHESGESNVAPMFYAHVADLHPDEPDGHLVAFTTIAIADRMVVYGLATPEEAVEALLHEHDQRLNNHAKRRKIRWHDDANVSRVLEAHRKDIKAIHRRFVQEGQDGG